MKILQIANYSEGVGGISVQVKLIRDHLLSDGVECAVLSTKGNVLRRIVVIMRLFFLGKKYDVFHVHACSDRGFFPGVIGISIGHLLKKRVVLTFHGGGAEVFFRRHPRLVRYFLTMTDANIVLSGFIGNIYEEYHIPYSIIPNIIELKSDVFKERGELAPRFICIRSFREIYNIECSLRAFHRVQTLYPDARLVLLGDGPCRGFLEHYVKAEKIQNVSFVGQVNNAEIYHYLSQCDIMVSSSRFDNMPVSILEGFNAGLLVIASNVGGVPYMIQDGENGLLFESDNDEEMAQKMVFALENPARAQMIIKKAHQSLQQHCWDYCCPKLMSLYKGD